MISLYTMLSWAALVLTAASAPLESRDVVDPPITNPKAGTVWTVGEHEKVEWDTSALPPLANITNSVGMVVLGYIDSSDPDGGEHLDLDSPLAKGFPITQGSVDVTVPSVTPRADYIIVLFGDSGNLSPKFPINVGISGGSSSSALSSTSASTLSSSTASSSATEPTFTTASTSVATIPTTTTSRSAAAAATTSTAPTPSPTTTSTDTSSSTNTPVGTSSTTVVVAVSTTTTVATSSASSTAASKSSATSGASAASGVSSATSSFASVTRTSASGSAAAATQSSKSAALEAHGVNALGCILVGAVLALVAL